MPEIAENFNLSDKDKERFYKKVLKTDSTSDCWLWNASKRRRGYGQFQIGSANYVATRIAYYLNYGKFDKSNLVLHTCDIPECVNPHHLFLGTNKQNTQDMMKKRRHIAQRGIEHHHAKFTEEIISEIKNRYKSGGIRQWELAIEYNTNQGHISAIINGKKWKHIKIKEA